MIKITEDTTKIEGNATEICANIVHFGIALLKSDNIKEAMLEMLDEANTRAESAGNEDFLKTNAVIKKYIKALFDDAKILKEVEEEEEE